MNFVKWMVRIGLLAAIALFLSGCDSGSDDKDAQIAKMQGQMDEMEAEKDAEIAQMQTQMDEMKADMEAMETKMAGMEEPKDTMMMGARLTAVQDAAWQGHLRQP
jgi:Tfp pilus assembly protein PilP